MKNYHWVIRTQEATHWAIYYQASFVLFGDPKLPQLRALNST